jgi:Fe-S-cluster containining protein
MEVVECLNPKTGKPCCGVGLCCSGKFFVELTKADLRRLSSAFNLDEVTTITSGVTTLKQKEGWCMFFDKGSRRCTIHEKRTEKGELVEPIECRIFPLVFKDKTVSLNPKCPGCRRVADSKTKAGIGLLYKQYETELEE